MCISSVIVFCIKWSGAITFTYNYVKIFFSLLSQALSVILSQSALGV
jgi:hypothetical protein